MTKHLSEPKGLSATKPPESGSSLPESGLREITLVVNCGHLPSKKNHHFPGPNGRVLIDKPIKKRMLELENAIASALFSASPTTGSVTGLEWRKQLQTLLCGLSDDSIREIPACSWSVERVEPGSEGATITITKL